MQQYDHITTCPCILRTAIRVFLPFFTFENDFKNYVVVKLRENYEVVLKKKPRGYLNVLSSEGTRLGAIKEVSWW